MGRLLRYYYLDESEYATLTRNEQQLKEHRRNCNFPLDTWERCEECTYLEDATSIPYEEDDSHQRISEIPATRIILTKEKLSKYIEKFTKENLSYEVSVLASILEEMATDLVIIDYS